MERRKPCPRVFFIVPLLVVALWPGSARAATVTLYANDFQAAVGPAWSPANLGTVAPPSDPNRRFLGCHDPASPGIDLGLGSHFLPQFHCPAVSLTLTGLPVHSSLLLSFDLYVIQSWDGNNSTFGPDILDVAVAGGPTLLHTTFSNVLTSGFDQSYPGTHPAATNATHTGAAEINSLGLSVHRGLGLPPELRVPPLGWLRDLQLRLDRPPADL